MVCIAIARKFTEKRWVLAVCQSYSSKSQVRTPPHLSRQNTRLTEYITKACSIFPAVSVNSYRDGLRVGKKALGLSSKRWVI